MSEQTLGEYNGFEVYRMPMFVTLVVSDVAATAAWYVDALGFGIMFEGPVTHLRRRKYQDILLVAATPERTPTGGGPAISFAADGEVDAIAERARAVAASGAARIDGPCDTPWNTRDLRVLDPAGHRLVFTSPRADPDPEVARRWQEMFEAGRKPR